jgi:hypothetical protein
MVWIHPDLFMIYAFPKKERESAGIRDTPEKFF